MLTKAEGGSGFSSKEVMYVKSTLDGSRCSVRRCAERLLCVPWLDPHSSPSLDALHLCAMVNMEPRNGAALGFDLWRVSPGLISP